MGARRRLDRLIEIRSRPFHLPQFIVHNENGLETKVGRSVRAKGPIARAKSRNEKFLPALPDRDLMRQPGRHSDHSGGVAKQNRRLVAGQRGRVKLAVLHGLRPDQMEQREHTRNGRFSVLPAHAQDGTTSPPAITGLSVIDPKQETPLPVSEQNRLANKLARRNSEIALDPGAVLLAAG